MHLHAGGVSDDEEDVSDTSGGAVDGEASVEPSIEVTHAAASEGFCYTCDACVCLHCFLSLASEISLIGLPHLHLCTQVSDDDDDELDEDDLLEAVYAAEIDDREAELARVQNSATVL